MYNKVLERGGRVRGVRAFLGLTQAQMAELCGVTRVTWCRYEKEDVLPAQVRIFLQGYAGERGWKGAVYPIKDAPIYYYGAADLKDLRVWGGYTQEDMARLLGVSKQVYGRWERRENKPSRENYKVVQAFWDARTGIDGMQFLDWAPEEYEDIDTTIDKFRFSSAKV